MDHAEKIEGHDDLGRHDKKVDDRLDAAIGKLRECIGDARIDRPGCRHLEIGEREDMDSGRLHEHADRIGDVIDWEPDEANDGDGVECDLEEHVQIHGLSRLEKHFYHSPAVGEEEAVEGMSEADQTIESILEAAGLVLVDDGIRVEIDLVAVLEPAETELGILCGRHAVPAVHPFDDVPGECQSGRSRHGRGIDRLPERVLDAGILVIEDAGLLGPEILL